MFIPNIHVNGNLVTVEGMSPQEGHVWLSEAVLDGNIPVWAPIGFYINLFEDIHGGMGGVYDLRQTGAPTMLHRGGSFQETALAISTNLRGTLFSGLTHNHAEVHSEARVGKFFTDDANWVETGKADSGTYAVTINHKYIANSFKKAEIDLYVSMYCGYRTMEENAKMLRNDFHRYTPIASEHTLNRYLRVVALPDQSGASRVQYLNGMTAAKFEKMWKEAQEFGVSL